MAEGGNHVITVNDIDNFIDSLAHTYTKESWDNVGLLCGRRSKPVEKILIALDPFAHVCQEAVEWGADVLVTHHPIIFHALKTVNDDTEIGRCLLTLAENGIAAINAHTNLDKAAAGVNHVLAQRLGLQNIDLFRPEAEDNYGNPIGLLRVGTVEAQSVEAFALHVKEALGCKGVRYVSGGQPVRKVAVGGGSCGSALYEIAGDCDTLVTADIKYNQFWDAKALGVNLIDAGHFYTENPVCEYLAEQLRQRFPDVSVKISETHADCMEFA